LIEQEYSPEQVSGVLKKKRGISHLNGFISLSGKINIKKELYLLI
jgi:hypothetical protein